MIIKLIAAISIIGIAVFIAVGFELWEGLQNVRLSDGEINSCFKEVRKWK